MTRPPRHRRGTGPFGAALLTVLFALLALSIATWVRSYWASDAWTYREARTTDDGRVDVLLLEAWSGQGSLVLSRHQWKFYSHGEPLGRRFRWTRHPPVGAVHGLAEFDPVISPLGFGYARDISGPPVIALIMPSWSLVLLLALPTAWLARRAYVRARRRRLGLCAQCGYDLRASAGKCPECGADVPAPPAAQPAATPR